MSKVYVVGTPRISEDGNVEDMPAVPFLNSRNPLFIVAREGQKKRASREIKENKLDGTAIGYWELKGKYLKKDGTVNWDNLNKHDVIFLASPDRVPVGIRPVYKALVDFLNE